jgi:hypothetical protein
MSNDPVGRRPRSADLQSTLRLVALAAVSLGVVVLAAAAFVLSYEGIHHIALRAGVSPGLAKLYPLIFDVMLVVAGAAALALRGAGWWARCYAWGSLLILLAAMAVGNAVYASGTTLPAQPTKIAVAIIPWVLLLMAFGLLLEMLRHFRTTRSRAATAAVGAAAPGAAAPGAAVAGAAVAGTVVGTDVNGGPPTAANQAAVSGGKARELPRVDLDTLLGPRAGEPPAIALLHGMGTGQNDGQQVDPVSYGEETGYVHPDSYLDEGEYSPHGDTGGPRSPDGLAGDTGGDGTHLAGHGTAPAEAPATAEAPTAPAEVLPAAAGGPAAPAAGLADPETARTTSAETPATPAAAPATSAEPQATMTGRPAEHAESPANLAAGAATAAEPQATTTGRPAEHAESPANLAAGAATAAEPLFTPAAPATAAEPQATTTGRPAEHAESPANPAATAETATEPLFTPTAPATAAEAPATPAEPPTAPAEPPAPTAETPDAAPVATAAPVGAQAGEAASGTGNGLAAGGGPAGAETPAGQEGAADAEQGAGVAPEAVGAEGPALERIRSTPTRPEE